MKPIYIVSLIIFLCVGLRLVNLDKGYSSDEGWLLKVAGSDFNKIVPALRTGNSVFPPLSPFLVHFWMRVSTAEPWVRGYFVFFGVAICILVYQLGRLFIDRAFGQIAFFASAVSPLLIWASQFVRSYIDSAFWALLSIYFMLRILKRAGSIGVFLGYVVSSLLAIYSSHLFIPLLIAQNIFIFIFYLRDVAFLRKWLVSQSILITLSLPCLTLLASQVNHASGMADRWASKGLHLFGVNIGHYPRGIAAVIGMDPGFLTGYALTDKFNKLILIGIAAISLFLAVWVIYRGISKLKAGMADIRLALFFPAILVLSLIIYDIAGYLLATPLQQAEYFIVQHILFIFIMAVFVYSIKKEKLNLKLLLLAGIGAVYLLRFGDAVKPEFDTKKASIYLFRNIKPEDTLLMVRNTNTYIDSNMPNAVVMAEFLQRNHDSGYYEPLNKKAKAKLSEIKEKSSDLWFYKLYSNDDILGANRLIEDWLAKNGYQVYRAEKFRKISIINYKK